VCSPVACAEQVGSYCGDDGCGGTCPCDGADGQLCQNNVCCHDLDKFCGGPGDCCSGNCVTNACKP
jgi:hypothetical protein